MEKVNSGVSAGWNIPLLCRQWNNRKMYFQMYRLNTLIDWFTKNSVSSGSYRVQEGNKRRQLSGQTIQKNKVPLKNAREEIELKNKHFDWDRKTSVSNRNAWKGRRIFSSPLPATSHFISFTPTRKKPMAQIKNETIVCLKRLCTTFML